MTTPNKTPPGADPKQLERTATVREIGSQAVWSLSSCKPGFLCVAMAVLELCRPGWPRTQKSTRLHLPSARIKGFGVDQLRDDNLETYWQSDGSQPHLVNIQFRSLVAFNLPASFAIPCRALDEMSRRRKTTVKTLCIYADYKSDESYTPSKISVRVGNNFHNLQEIRAKPQLELVEPSGWIHVPLTDNHKKPTRTFMIQIAVLANHQNGRDTHMRQIKIYTPVEESSIGKFPRCTTIDFMMYRSIR
ncbi:Anaphase-promoting complex subunit 10 [Apodemus speciosus]|uniref:Anaphase-promoting complex subunit 10 n=1 Tax=Apodemus speciosus TaxID=105296 RepID=A0ABQ0F2E9_APOSI